jgi:hypothetical protein
VGEGLTPAPWQAFDGRPPDRRSPDHIDIAECSSVLALSLGGNPTGTVKAKVRRRTRSGVLYDTFAPWQLLNIQCFPDDEHSLRRDDSKKHLCNGPYAFLDALCVEYRDAVKRYTHVNEMITKLITPPVRPFLSISPFAPFFLTLHLFAFPPVCFLPTFLFYPFSHLN